jgi:hypothetical protein
LLRINSIFQPNLFGTHNHGYAPVDLNRFLATGDIWQSTGGPSQQDYLQMMQAQMMAQLLMQLDPMLLLQMVMANMLNNAMNGGRDRGSLNAGGFSNRRSVGNGSWPRSSASAHNHGGHSHSTGRTDGPRSRGERGIPDGLRPNAANGARVVREMGFTGTIGGLGHRAGKSDHPHGNAIDVMTHGDTRMGRQVAEHFRQNHDELGVKYVIYQQHIASPRTGWQWRRMEDRGNPTANHMDHPHISFH